MNAKTTQQHALEETKVSLTLKLAALWTSFMFLYIYVDYFHLYMPSSLEDMVSGKMWEFAVTPAILFAGLASVTIPALMVFLSVGMPAKISRWTNIVVATVYIPYSLFNLAGEAWPHMLFGAAVEIVLLLLIIRYAWTWPRIEPSVSGR